jgi:hypothetical protein
MKKTVFFMLILGIIGSTFVFSQAQGKTMYVVVKSTDIKSSTGMFANKVGVFNLGDTVTMLRTSGNWAEIRAGSVTGWVNLSGLSSKRVTGSGGSSSAGEIALAGKGFSPETEVEYRKNGLDYSVVDQMEQITIPANDLRKFIEDGRLVKGK